MVSVYLYVPNLIGYLRLILILVAWFLWDTSPTLFVWLYSTSAVLDAIDGIAARRLNQSSAFGAWFDVVIDNVGRTMIWCGLEPWGWMIAVLEWCTFACTHSNGSHWKESFEQAPFWVKAVMAKGFKQPVGTLTISGLHALPIFHYGMQRGLLAWLNPLLQPLRLLLVVGRVLCGAVECWCVVEHIRQLELSTQRNQQ